MIKRSFPPNFVEYPFDDIVKLCLHSGQLYTFKTA